MPASRQNPVRRLRTYREPLNHNAVRAALNELQAGPPEQWDERLPPRPCREPAEPTWFDTAFTPYATALARARHK